MVDAAVAGMLPGVVYAVLAMCLIVLFRLAGTLNLALTSFGAFGVYLLHHAASAGIPLPWAVALGFGASALIAGGAGWVILTWFTHADEKQRLIISAVMLLIVLTAGYRAFGDSPRAMVSLFPQSYFRLASVNVPSSVVGALVIMVVVSLGVALVLLRTRMGLVLQALSQSTRNAELMGINSRLIAVGVWATTGVLSALALTLVAPIGNPTFGSMALVIVPAAGAALVAGFKHMWLGAVTGLGMGIIEGLAINVESLVNARSLLPFIAVIIVTVLLRKGQRWDALR